MHIGRREFILTAGAVVAALGTPAWAAPQMAPGTKTMYGQIGKMIALPGKRDELIALLLENVDAMPGCLSYIVAADPSDENGIWVTEAWDSKESHDGSLKLPGVKKSIDKARPMIAGFGDSFLTTPVGGHGLKPTG
jgi:quinol monooxygenase YgiN